MVDGAVSIEPVSRLQNSLINRENTGNLRDFGFVLAFRETKNTDGSWGFSANSLLNRTGNFSGGTGNFFRGTGNFPSRSRKSEFVTHKLIAGLRANFAG